MRIIISKHGGFCKGVSRAVETAEKISGKGVYILGDLIHNERVMNKIKNLGSTVVYSPEEVKGGKVLIRSHGEPKKVFDYFDEKGIEVIDCTCPFVKRTQKIVSEYAEKGYKIIIVGEKNHPEVIGINGWCGFKALISDGETCDLSDIREENACIVAQTTFSNEKFERFLQKFPKNRFKTVEVFDTICYTTKERQEETERLAETCDCMVVIGSKRSSNTLKLFEICRKRCKNVIWVESAEILAQENLVSFKKVGIVTGASTPIDRSREVFLSMENSTEAVKVNEAEVNEAATEAVAEQKAEPVKEAVKPMSEMEEAVAKMDEKQTKFKKGQKITATISSATDEGLAVYISNTKKEILLPKEEIDCETYDKAAYSAKVGEEIEVKIIGLNPVQLSEKAIKRDIEEAAAVKEIADGQKEFSVVVDGFNKGGLIGHYAGYEVFIPSSQIRIGFVKELDKYVGKTLRLKAEKVESGRRKQIVASQRVILEAEKAARDAERAAKEEEFFGAVSVGDIIKGTVVRFASFGAFVDVNGIDCLAHISDLSWTGCNAPADVLEIGKEYEFKVLKCDKETKKVSLGYKQLQTRPWDLVPGKYMVGDVIKGKVVRIVPFGAFVEIEKGIDGLVHVSQISHEWLENPTSALKVGEEVEAKIIAIDHEKEKITLSIKAMTPAPENAAKAPRKERVADGEEGEDKPRKARKPRVEGDDGEVREWKDNSDGGVSIAELLADNNK
ncbi:MAG: 4-hydroxy-3-methylbut-2-enyl diphosphate reductase [Candidatus Borkfalkiaceae bacterium]|nr:4-hydroxy-3-methylbut-2-enyl diphosphate reductase [Christensenellaceae bacterium]